MKNIKITKEVYLSVWVGLLIVAGVFIYKSFAADESKDCTNMSTGDVVINEFSSASAEEWVELLNTTSNPIDLTACTLRYMHGGAPIDVAISVSVPPRGLVVVTPPADTLDNDGGTLMLNDANTATVSGLSYGNDSSIPPTIAGGSVPSDEQSLALSFGPGPVWSVGTPTKGWFNNAVAVDENCQPVSENPPLLSGESGIGACLAVPKEGISIVTNIGDILNPSATPAGEGALYFEAKEEGTSLGRITFTGSLNLTDFATIGLLKEIGEKMTKSQGKVGLDASTADLLKNAHASLTIYGLGGGGEGYASTPAIRAYDDSNTVIPFDAEDNTAYSFLNDISFDTESGNLTFNTEHFTSFETHPTISEITAVPSFTSNNNPSYTFTSDAPGSIAYNGSCKSNTTAVEETGSITITLDSNGLGADLAEGLHSDCTITVTDNAGHASNELHITNFTVDTVSPVFTDVSPANDSYINNVTTSSDVSYTLSENVASAFISINEDDIHCTLVGTAKNSGTHTINFADTTNGCSEAVSLSNESVYTFAFNATDAATNAAEAITRTGITFDSIAPTVTKLGGTLPPTPSGPRPNLHGATLKFSEKLSDASKTTVETALQDEATADSSRTLTLVWGSGDHANWLRVSYNGENADPEVPPTFAHDVSATVTDPAGNSATLLLIDTSAPTLLSAQIISGNQMRLEYSEQVTGSGEDYTDFRIAGEESSRNIEGYLNDEGDTITLTFGGDPVTAPATGTIDINNPPLSVRDLVGNELALINDHAVTDGQTAPSTVYVDDDWTNPATANTAGHIWLYNAFDNVQDAVDTVAVGGTINIAGGHYTTGSQINLNKAVTLDGPGIASLDPATIINNNCYYVFTISASNVTVRDLFIHQTNGDLEYCQSYPAIRIQGSNVAGVSITSNDIAGGYRGVQIRNDASSNTVSDNKIHDNTVGVAISGSMNNTVSGNEIYTNEAQGILFRPGSCDGECVYDADGNIIQNNNIHNNYYGISIDESMTAGTTATLIDSNTINENDCEGILINSDVAGFTITGNNITNNGGSCNTTGINTSSTDHILIHNNTISGNDSGITNNTDGTLDATRNYFGAANGPSGQGSGDGDSVSTFVNFAPYYINAARTLLSENNISVTDLSPVTFSVPSGVTDATLDVSALLLAGSGLIPAMTITADTSVGTVTVVIPEGTTATGGAGWGGILNVPTVQPNSTVTISGGTVSSVVEIGFGDTLITFDKAVRILIPGKSGQRTGYSRSGIFTEITTVCTDDTQATNNLLSAGGDCKIDVGSDLVIWTKHFTKFSTYTTASSGGSSGGYLPGYGPNAKAPAPVLATNPPTPSTSSPQAGSGQATKIIPKPTSLAIFNRDLTLGSVGEDARALQKFLNGRGFIIVATGAGSPGHESNYFGSRTQMALAKYQASVGLPAIGRYGPQTRAFIKKQSAQPLVVPAQPKVISPITVKTQVKVVPPPAKSFFSGYNSCRAARKGVWFCLTHASQF